MSEHEKFSCYIVGDSTLPIQCGEILLSSGHEICGIVTTETAISRWAEERNIPAISPAENMAEFLGQKPFDYLFSIVNEHILRADILSLPGKFAINYHDAPLPRYAGTHATSWALMNREKSHGITWHVISDQVDAGEILKQRQVEIAEHETAFTLNTKCYEAAIGAFAELVDDLSRNDLVAVKQNLEERTFYPRFKRPEAGCVISWKNPAEETAALVRALDFGPHPNPLGTPKLSIREDFIVAREADVLTSISNRPPGTVIEIKPDAIKVATKSHDLALRKAFAADGQPLSIDHLVDRYELREGDKLDDLSLETATQLERFSAECCKHESYWVKRLTGLQAPELPYVSRNHTGKASAQYAREMMQVPAETHHFLATMEGESTVAEYLLAAFGVYLSRIGNTDQHDLGYRDSALAKELGGIEKLFVSYLPLRIEVNTSQNFETWSSALQQSLDEVRKHKTYLRDVVGRYPELREGVKAERKYSLPVNIDLVETLDGYVPTTEGELTLLIPKHGTQCLWVYDSRVLGPASVARMISQFSTFLQGIAKEPDHSLATQPLMPVEELHQVLIEWNDTKTKFPGDECIHHLVESQAARTPDAIAAVYDNERLTYRELNGRANQLAHYLRTLGVGPEVLVGISVKRSLEMLVGVLGVLKAGGAYVPLDPAYPKNRVAFMLEDSQAPVLLTQRELVAGLSEHNAQVVCLDSDWHRIARMSQQNLAFEQTPNSLAYVIYTSGSTGRPKGVAIEHRSTVAFLYWATSVFTPEQLRGTLASTSVCFDLSVYEMFAPLCCGGAVILVENVLHLPTAPAASEVTLINTVPSAITELLRIKGVPASVRTVNLAGEPLKTALVRQIYESSKVREVFDLYGPTEDTTYSTFTLRRGHGPTTIGRPISNTQAYILDRSLQPVPADIPGELYLGGDGLARGYLNRPELTAERFLRNPFSPEPQARIYKTGDLARYYPNGEIEYLGRIDNQVKIRGFRIELGEIEAAILAHPTVRESVVIAREDQPGDKRLVAYFVGNPKTDIADGVLREFLREKLPDFMVPAAFVKLEALPLTPNGKVDRRALPVPDTSRLEIAETFVAHRDELERHLTNIWEEILATQPIGVTDNFFDLGGHSLLAVRMFAQIEKKYGRNLPLATLFQAPTIEKLANVLREEGKATAWSSLVAIQPEGSRPPFFCIHARGGNVLFYRDLARRLGTDQPFYGLQMQGLDGKQPYHTRIEEMAAHYILEIKKVQREGPYYIGGASFGGTAAFEIAQQLHAQGEKVAVLAVFDTGGPGYPEFQPVTTLTRYKNRIQSFARRVNHIVRALKMLDQGQRVPYVRHKGRKAKVNLKRSVRRRMIKIASRLPSSISRLLLPPYVNARWAQLDLERAIGQLLKAYVHQEYPGRMALFRASKQPLGIYPDPTLGWGQLVTGGLEIHEVPGHHGTIVAEPNVRFLAEQLKRCLETQVAAQEIDTFNEIATEDEEPEYSVRSVSVA